MTTIETWLKEIGLERYLELFRDNDIEPDVLPDLTETDFEKLGISLGHRKKLMRAIASLGDQEAVSVVESPSLQASKPPSSAVSQEGERRQLTVMFCDLVGSTALSTKLDPEDLGQVMVAYQEAAAGEITKFGGHIAKFMGDGVLAYFGWPRAYEHDAERAVKAGLELVDVIGRLKAPDKTPLACRVGIATGPVVVGDLIGDGAAQEEAVVGETPNLAARLEALAEAGQVVLSASTRRLIGELFDVVELGEHHLKGFDRPIEAWRALGERSLESRFEAKSHDAAPIIGRSRELDLMTDLWTKARSGKGHVVLVSGEAGIGKSRLTAELDSVASRDHHTRLRYQCSPFHEDSPLYPVIQQLERASKLQPSDADETKLDKLEQLLAVAKAEPTDVAPLFASLLSIATADRYPDRNLSPQKQKDLTLQALTEQLRGLSCREPVLLLFEDLHWIDPTSLELLDRLIEIVPTIPALLILTFRPEFRAPWVGQAHVASIILNRLSTEAGSDLIRRITGNRALPKDVEDQILAKTDGVPLFVEELTKALLESGLFEAKSGDYQPVHDMPHLAIPETLQDSLMARLDRLAPVKEVAQIGAVLGREFSYDMIAAISDLDTRELNTALDQLSEAELIYARGRPPDATYIFKHALVQDAAYSSLLKSRRQQWHARVVHVLEKNFQHTVEHEPELVARHAAAAGQIEKAITFWHRAAERANIRSANAEAEGHINKALASLDDLAMDSRERERGRLLTLLGRVLTAKNGYGHTDVAKFYQEARELGQASEDPSSLFPALLGLSIYSAVRTELVSGIAMCEQLIDLAKASGDEVWTVEAHYAAGVTYSWRGAFNQARHHLEFAFDHYDTEQHEAHLALYGQDGGPVCLCRNAMVLWYLGYPDQALAWMERALQLTEELGHPFSRIYILTWAAWLRQHRRELDEAIYWNERTLDYAAEQKFPFWAAMGTVQRGWLTLENGQIDRGITFIKDGIDQLKRHGTEVTQAYSMGLLGEALGRYGDIDAGLAVIDESLEKIEATKEEWCKAELLRARGNITWLARRNSMSEVETWYQKAIKAAQDEDAKAWELRAATSLAQLWADEGQKEDARSLLEPIVGWFQEGFDTPDLKDAKSVLDGLQRFT
ncbi:MAG: adenylate/guanylate cyclase domain-containing protein [Pseudomonadota bacterium]